MIEIAKYSPCPEALKYRATHDSFESAWRACPRGDWMLWIASRVKVDKRTLTLAKALCAKTVIHLMTDERSRKAVEVAEAYGRGNATEDELAAAADDAAAAYAAAYADYAAAYVAYAAAYADYAAYAAASADRKKNRLATADICRDILTEAVLTKLNTTKPIEP